MKNKKAMVAGKLITIMIVLVAFVLIVGTIVRFQAKAKGVEAEIACHNSLILKASVKIDLGATDLSTPALCKTLDYDFSARDKEQAMNYFGKKMERCWWIWLEGEYNEIFGSRGWFEGDAPKCFVCSTVAYEKGPEFSRTELLDEMSKLNAKTGGDVLSYIQDKGYTLFLEETYPSDNVYAMIFASNMDQDLFKDIVEAGLWGFVLPGGGGLTNPFAIHKIYYDVFLAEEKPNQENGIWLMSLDRFEQTQPCYYESDVSGN